MHCGSTASGHATWADTGRGRSRRRARPDRPDPARREGRGSAGWLHLLPEVLRCRCRYGDYSAAEFWDRRVHMATEYVAHTPRDTFTNWAKLRRCHHL